MRHVSELTVANLPQAKAGPSCAVEAESALLVRMLDKDLKPL